MRVGFITPSVSRGAGGIFEVERRLAQCLNQIPDVDVQVFGSRDESTEQDYASWKPLEPQLFRAVGPHAFRYSPAMVSALRAGKLDIAHLQVLWMYTSIATLQWSGRKHRPYLVSIHGMLDAWAVNNARFKKRLIGALYERSCLKRARCIHAITESEVKSIRDFRLKNPVCLIPNAIDLPQRSYAPDDTPWKDKIPAGEKILLYLGRIHPKKGLLNLLEAWKGATSQRSGADKWNLVIAGWEQDGHEGLLKEAAASLGIKSSVHFIGPQFNMHKEKCYFHTDAFILPSLSEGLPMVVLEAWAYGKPVLMTPQCNLPIGYEAHAALKIEANAAHIAAGLHALFDMSAGDRSEMGKRGRKLVEENFTWQKAAAELHRVYEWVLGGGSVPDSVMLS